MLSLFASLKDNVPMGAKKLQAPHTEGLCNKLHYRVTFVLLLGCSLMVTCLEWVGAGKKIACVMEGPDDSWTIPLNVINTYCYVMTTFTLPKHWTTKLGIESVQPGVGDYNPKTDEVHYKAYYQWVSFVLFFQACTFYAPHYIFKIWEGGKVKNIIAGLNQLILDKKDRADKEKILAQYFVEAMNTHTFWAMKMLLVDFMNLINCVGNIYLVDAFLGGEFSTYGIKVLNFLEADPENRIDPMAMIFPRVTKCSFYKYGPSGTIQTHDSICVLPINIINEKIYVFLWFWLIILSFISIVGLISHVVSMLIPQITKMNLKSRAMNRKDVNLDDMGRHFEIGDWKLLYILGTNMEPLVFGEFLQELSRAIRDSNQNSVATSPLLQSKEML